RAAAGAVPPAGRAVQDSGGGGDLAALVAAQRRVPRERGPRGIRAGGGARAHAEGERPGERGGARRGRRDRARDVPAGEGRRGGSRRTSGTSPSTSKTRAPRSCRSWAAASTIGPTCSADSACSIRTS